MGLGIWKKRPCAATCRRALLVAVGRPVLIGQVSGFNAFRLHLRFMRLTTMRFQLPNLG
jgi:hypothetical protein